MQQVLVSWSGGKDSAMALSEILKSPDYQVSALLTTVTEGYERISMHGVRRSLLRQQAASIGIPLEEVLIPQKASNEEYESRMGMLLDRYKKLGVTAVVFGDIFLEDLRAYREKKMAQSGLKCIFPLWKRATKDLARSFIASGFKAVTTCVDTQTLGKEFVGREIDESFLSELPPNVDPCGENGEYHSFVHAGPILKTRIPFRLGEKELREDRFYFCDLLPETGST